MGIFFSARKDEKDRQESHYIPMMGKDEFYKYEVRIKTGSFPGAGNVPFTCLSVTNDRILRNLNSPLFVSF